MGTGFLLPERTKPCFVRPQNTVSSLKHDQIHNRVLWMLKTRVFPQTVFSVSINHGLSETSSLMFTHKTRLFQNRVLRLIKPRFSESSVF